jgi:hypothetical protein
MNHDTRRDFADQAYVLALHANTNMLAGGEAEGAGDHNGAVARWEVSRTQALVSIAKSLAVLADAFATQD